MYVENEFFPTLASVFDFYYLQFVLRRGSEFNPSFSPRTTELGVRGLSSHINAPGT